MCIRDRILTDRPRMERLYPPEPGESQAWAASMQRLADSPRVKGQVVWDVESLSPAIGAAYTAWQDDPLSVEKANAVTAAIRGWIYSDGLKTFPNLTYIVLAGDDQVLPALRWPIDPDTVAAAGGGVSIGAGSGRHVGPDNRVGWRSEAEYLDDGSIERRSPLGLSLIHISEPTRPY